MQPALPTLKTSMSSREFFNTYADHIGGWCHAELADILSNLNESQRARGISGSVGEIGVYDGKFFLLLNYFTSDNESAYAIDLFDRQELNIDCSGSGTSLANFQSNLSKYDKHAGANVKIVEGDSTCIDFRLVVQEPLRIISIDGGHTAEHTICDLKTSQAIMHPEGIVIVDDILNSHWLGVIEGVTTFLLAKPTLAPFAIGYNKLFMAHFAHVERYRQLLIAAGGISKSAVPFLGYTLAAY